ncbi:hypothetical protein [Nannocystis bainbridge]|uniref:Aminoglycoside phosphotransferase domain-containing protein n=1 Tax=Nannocystis bainbridge TaxID=2995303 RepID=A0ABT5E319_9BACT|nr:hypothetical protein [Nannocystis bainbridge]MDC0719131.1 hypothetical protein [Nannocystis bainbridge]
MILSELIPRVTAQFRMLAAGLALDPATLTVRHVAERAAASRASFSIADAGARFDLELAADPAGHAALRRWHDLGATLATRYHAPRICGWLEIVDTPYAGLLREHVDGVVVRDLSEAPDLARVLTTMIGRLHADRDLASRLPGPAPTCCEAYLVDQFVRCTASLRAARAAGPAFVDTATLAWLAAEVDRVTAQVRASNSFAVPADLPVHGALLRPGNLCVTPAGAWYVLGWDALRLGDPALDLAALPPVTVTIDPRADTMQATRAIREPWLSDRIALLRRARSLAAAIDPLADWLAAAAWDEPRERAQARAERAHAAALLSYRQDHP